MDIIKYLQRGRKKWNKGFTLIELLLAVNIGVLFLALVFTLLKNFSNSANIIKTKIELEQNSIFISKYIEADLKETVSITITNDSIYLNRKNKTKARYTLESDGNLKYGKLGVGYGELANNVKTLSILDQDLYFEMVLVLEKEGIVVEKKQKVFKELYEKTNRIYND